MYENYIEELILCIFKIIFINIIIPKITFIYLFELPIRIIFRYTIKLSHNYTVSVCFLKYYFYHAKKIYILFLYPKSIC